MANISSDQLKKSATDGEKHAAQALSTLAKREVNVTTNDVRSVSLDEARQALDKVKEHAVIAYAEAITGISGSCILSMDRTDALNLVDLFNNRPQGSTVVMQEIDRSTIKETLNILGNAYVTEMAKVLGTSVMLNVPKLATKEKLTAVSALSGSANAGDVVLFETSLNVAGVDFQLVLYFFFLTGSPEGMPTELPSNGAQAPVPPASSAPPTSPASSPATTPPPSPPAPPISPLADGDTAPPAQESAPMTNPSTEPNQQ